MTDQRINGSTDQPRPFPEGGTTVYYSSRFLGLERAEVKLPTDEQWQAYRRRADAADAPAARADEARRLVRDLGLDLDADAAELTLGQLLDVEIEPAEQEGRELVMRGRALGLPVTARFRIPKLSTLRSGLEDQKPGRVLPFAREHLVGVEGYAGKPPAYHLQQLGLRLFIDVHELIGDSEVFFEPAASRNGNRPGASTAAGSPPSTSDAAEASAAGAPKTAVEKPNG